MTNNAPAVYKTGLTKINDAFMPMVESQLYQNGIQMTEYQRTCVLNSISAINELLFKEGLKINEIEQSNLTQTLLHIAALQLNAAATPREVYFIIRNQKNGDNGKVKVIEMGIEGDGNDALLSRFGRNVKTVHRHWEVREGDEFTYPGHNGLQVTPPTWGPKGKGKVIRVVYPIEYNDGQVEFFICEREDVKKNLIAHMFNNLMWDKKKTEKKTNISEYADTHSLDEMLDDKEMQTMGNISPAWKDPQSREAMIVRKMRNRIVKKHPKDFSNAYVSSVYEQTDDDFMIRQSTRKEAEIIQEIEKNANQTPFVPDPPAQQSLPENAGNHKMPDMQKEAELVDAEIIHEEQQTYAEEVDPY